MFVLGISLSFPFAAVAQQATYDVVYLRDGSVLRGNILRFDPNKEIEIQLMNGTVLVYPGRKVEEIAQVPYLSEEQPTADSSAVDTVVKITAKTNASVPPSVINNVKHLPSIALEEGLWLMVSAGHFTPNNPDFGVFVDGLVGYRPHPCVMMGVNVGVALRGDFDNFHFGPIVRANLMKKPFTPYVEFAVGYGYVRYNGYRYPEHTENGGLFLRPSVGVQLSSRRKTHFFIALDWYQQQTSISGIRPTFGYFLEKQTLSTAGIRLGAIF